MRPDAATLRLALLPRGGILADLALVTLGAALVALGAQISIALPFTPVPITAQTFAVVLVGGSLGVVRGAASLSLYVLLGLVGVPVYSDGGSGWDVISGATGGYLIGFVAAAALAGALAERRLDRRLSSSIAAMLTANVVVYLVGVPWLAAAADYGLEEALEKGLYPFVVGDLVKLYLAGALLPAAWKFVERTRARS
ncbi:MAG TPA: biotin transporter BioY [Gaiellaceae bacterium]|nr:biotin transporter BioY [Gaiellaceae bacterium]